MDVRKIRMPSNPTPSCLGYLLSQNLCVASGIRIAFNTLNRSIFDDLRRQYYAPGPYSHPEQRWPGFRVSESTPGYIWDTTDFTRYDPQEPAYFVVIGKRKKERDAEVLSALDVARRGRMNLSGKEKSFIHLETLLSYSDYAVAICSELSRIHFASTQSCMANEFLTSDKPYHKELGLLLFNGISFVEQYYGLQPQPQEESSDERTRCST